MIIHDDNNVISSAKSTVEHAGEVTTFGDLIGFIAECPQVPIDRRPYIISALNRVRRLLSNGAADLSADPKVVLTRLERLSPAMAGMTPQSFANLKSRVRGAFRIALPKLVSARSTVRLSGTWAKVDKQLLLPDRRLLSRFFRFAQARGCEPQEVGSDHLEAFSHYLSEDVVLPRFETVVRSTARAWNRAVEAVPTANLKPLPVPPPKRKPYWVRWDQLPPGLRQEIESYLQRRSSSDPFFGANSKPLAAGTVKQYRFAFIQLVSSLVVTGTPIDELCSLPRLLTPHRLETALKFFYSRAGNRVTHQIETLAFRAYKVAQGIDCVPDQNLMQIAEICERVRRVAPYKRELAAKNRRLLEQVDNSGFVDRLVMLPERLMTDARKMKNSRFAASCTRDAVAIELLLTCSLRVGNLVDLRLGETIRRYGEDHDVRWVIEIPGDRVKNGQPLRFVLPRASVLLLEEYLRVWHSFWCGPATPWLFPNGTGSHISTKGLSYVIAQRTRRHLGVEITCHQFRHLTAELYLREDPNGIGVVSQHLGHRDLNTTRSFYAREQTRLATKRYHEVLIRTRAAVPHHGSTRRQRRADR